LDVIASSLQAGAGAAEGGAAGDPTYAALDLGTNNCRLLIARPLGRSFRVVDAFSRIVRLGEGLASSGSLSEAAMVRTIAALQVCAQKIARRGVTHARHVATEACRRAANCDLFLHRARRPASISRSSPRPRRRCSPSRAARRS
jgi:exopolyphosphatase / guanosine-5'-triphosphate,3'-diphosphate pyrophosphatase